MHGQPTGFSDFGHAVSDDEVILSGVSPFGKRIRPGALGLAAVFGAFAGQHAACQG